MKYITLFWEILIFIPILFFLFLINPDLNIPYNWFLLDIARFFHSFLSFFSINQIYIGLLFVITFLIAEIIWTLIKIFFFKPRPNPMEYNNLIEKVLAGSFPSLHSTRTFVLFLFALYFTNYYVAFGFFLFWLLIAYSRVYLKKHFWIDICGGVVLAIFSFFIVFKLTS